MPPTSIPGKKGAPTAFSKAALSIPSGVNFESGGSWSCADQGEVEVSNHLQRNPLSISLKCLNCVSVRGWLPVLEELYKSGISPPSLASLKKIEYRDVKSITGSGQLCGTQRTFLNPFLVRAVEESGKCRGYKM